MCETFLSTKGLTSTFSLNRIKYLKGKKMAGFIVVADVIFSHVRSLALRVAMSAGWSTTLL